MDEEVRLSVQIKAVRIDGMKFSGWGAVEPYLKLSFDNWWTHSTPTSKTGLYESFPEFQYSTRQPGRFPMKEFVIEVYEKSTLTRDKLLCATKLDLLNTITGPCDITAPLVLEGKDIAILHINLMSRHSVDTSISLSDVTVDFESVPPATGSASISACLQLPGCFPVEAALAPAPVRGAYRSSWNIPVAGSGDALRTSPNATDIYNLMGSWVRINVKLSAGGGPSGSEPLNAVAVLPTHAFYAYPAKPGEETAIAFEADLYTPPAGTDAVHPPPTAQGGGGYTPVGTVAGRIKWYGFPLYFHMASGRRVVTTGGPAGGVVQAGVFLLPDAPKRPTARIELLPGTPSHGAIVSREVGPAGASIVGIPGNTVAARLRSAAAGGGGITAGVRRLSIASGSGAAVGGAGATAAYSVDSTAVAALTSRIDAAKSSLDAAAAKIGALASETQAARAGKRSSPVASSGSLAAVSASALRGESSSFSTQAAQCGQQVEKILRVLEAWGADPSAASDPSYATHRGQLERELARHMAGQSAYGALAKKATALAEAKDAYDASAASAGAASSASSARALARADAADMQLHTSLQAARALVDDAYATVRQWTACTSAGDAEMRSAQAVAQAQAVDSTVTSLATRAAEEESLRASEGGLSGSAGGASAAAGTAAAARLSADYATYAAERDATYSEWAPYTGTGHDAAIDSLMAWRPAAASHVHHISSAGAVSQAARSVASEAAAVSAAGMAMGGAGGGGAMAMMSPEQIAAQLLAQGIIKPGDTVQIQMGGPAPTPAPAPAPVAGHRPGSVTLPSVWKRLQDASGRVYWQNEGTHTTAWSLPIQPIYDVTWSGPGPLGIVLQEQEIKPPMAIPARPTAPPLRRRVELQVTPTACTATSNSALLQAGHTLLAVNGRPVLGASWEATTATIASCGRPLTLRFFDPYAVSAETAALASDMHTAITHGPAGHLPVNEYAVVEAAPAPAPMMMAPAGYHGAAPRGYMMGPGGVPVGYMPGVPPSAGAYMGGGMPGYPAGMAPHPHAHGHPSMGGMPGAAPAGYTYPAGSTGGYGAPPGGFRPY